jgi:hypothetical protein
VLGKPAGVAWHLQPDTLVSTRSVGAVCVLLAGGTATRGSEVFSAQEAFQRLFPDVSTLFFSHPVRPSCGVEFTHERRIKCAWI